MSIRQNFELSLHQLDTSTFRSRSIIFKGKSIEDLLYHHSHPFNEEGFYSVSVLAKRYLDPDGMLKELNYVINSLSKNGLFDEKTVESYKKPIQKAINFYDSLLQKDMHV